MDEITFGQDFLLLQCSHDEGGREDDRKVKISLKRQSIAVVIEDRENCGGCRNKVETKVKTRANNVHPQSRLRNDELSQDIPPPPAVKEELGPEDHISSAKIPTNKAEKCALVGVPEEAKITSTETPAQAEAIATSPCAPPKGCCCFLCRSPDHQTKNCPTLQSAQCKRCGAKGHLEFKCPSRKKGRRKKAAPLFRLAGGSGETTGLQNGDPLLKGDQSILVTIANAGKDGIDQDSTEDKERCIQERDSASIEEPRDDAAPSKKPADTDENQAEEHEVEELKKRLQCLYKNLADLKGEDARNTTLSKDCSKPKKEKIHPEQREYPQLPPRSQGCKRKGDPPTERVSSSSPKRVKNYSKQRSTAASVPEREASNPTISTKAAISSPKRSGALEKKEASSSRRKTPPSSSPDADKFLSFHEVCKCSDVGHLSLCPQCPVFDLRLAQGKQTRQLQPGHGSFVTLSARAYAGDKTVGLPQKGGVYFVKVFKSAEAKSHPFVPHSCLAKAEPDGSLTLALLWEAEKRSVVLLSATDTLGKCQFVNGCRSNLFAVDNAKAVMREQSVRIRPGTELQCKITLRVRGKRNPQRPFGNSDDVWLSLKGEARSLVVKESQIMLRQDGKLGPLFANVTLVNPCNSDKIISLIAPSEIGNFFLIKSRQLDYDYLLKGRSNSMRKEDERENEGRNSTGQKKATCQTESTCTLKNSATAKKASDETRAETSLTGFGKLSSDPKASKHEVSKKSEVGETAKSRIGETGAVERSGAVATENTLEEENEKTKIIVKDGKNEGTSCGQAHEPSKPEETPEAEVQPEKNTGNAPSTLNLLSQKWTPQSPFQEKETGQTFFQHSTAKSFGMGNTLTSPCQPWWAKSPGGQSLEENEDPKQQINKQASNTLNSTNPKLSGKTEEEDKLLESAVKSAVKSKDDEKSYNDNDTDFGTLDEKAAPTQGSGEGEVVAPKNLSSGQNDSVVSEGNNAKHFVACCCKLGALVRCSSCPIYTLKAKAAENIKVSSVDTGYYTVSATVNHTNSQGSFSLCPTEGAVLKVFPTTRHPFIHAASDGRLVALADLREGLEVLGPDGAADVLIKRTNVCKDAIMKISEGSLLATCQLIR